MDTFVRLLPVVVLCAVLLAPTPVRSASIMHWLKFAINFFRTLFYYLIPIKQRQMDAIDDSLTELTKIMQEVMPVTGDLDHSEVKKFGLGGYTCCAFGSASDFRTFEKDGEVQCTWESDNTVIVKIPYTITNFNIHYGAFYMKTIGIKGVRVKGKVDMNIKINRMILEVEIPNVLAMLGKIAWERKCYVIINKLYFEKIGGIRVNVATHGMTRGATSSYLLTTYLNNNPEIMLPAVREAFLVNMYLRIHGKSNTLCVGQVIQDEVIRDKLVEPKKYSDKFYQHCGQSYDDPELVLENPNDKSLKKDKLLLLLKKPASKNI